MEDQKKDKERQEQFNKELREFNKSKEASENKENTLSKVMEMEILDI